MFHFSVPEIISGTSAVVGPRTSVPAVCTSDIFTPYQHNGRVLVGPWITFHWWVWPDWSTTSRAHWAKCGLYSGETQALWLPCHISSRYAEKKGRMSQIHHILCTQAVLTLARQNHQQRCWFVFTPTVVTKDKSLQWHKLYWMFNGNQESFNWIMQQWQNWWAQLGVGHKVPRFPLRLYVSQSALYWWHTGPCAVNKTLITKCNETFT